MTTMTVRHREELEQWLIDHEVRLSEAREAAQRNLEARAAWQADQQWYRSQLIAMLADARTEEELRGLGLSDKVVREAGLGASLAEAWRRFDPRHSPPSLAELARGGEPAPGSAPRPP